MNLEEKLIVGAAFAFVAAASAGVLGKFVSLLLVQAMGREDWKLLQHARQTFPAFDVGTVIDTRFVFQRRHLESKSEVVRRRGEQLRILVLIMAGAIAAAICLVFASGLVGSFRARTAAAFESSE